MKIVIVTSCMAGVAQSHMAALALKQAAEAQGHEALLEEQGAHKLAAKLTAAQIEDADVIILARAIAISGRERFQGRPALELSLMTALLDPKRTIERAVGLVEGR